MDIPQIRYAKAGEISIAYQESGTGPPDLLMMPGFISHRDLDWDHPVLRAGWERFGRFSRLIQYDKRGTGLSDPVAETPTLEDRCADALAVLDAVGSERAVAVGISEGAAAAILLAATHPERVTSLVLVSATARGTYADDYPFANRAEDMIQAGQEWIVPAWGTGASVETFAPDVEDVPGVREWYAKIERMGASPGMVSKLFAAYLQVDVRDVLPAITVPTLVIHRTGDRVVNVRHGRYLAEHIPGARLVELPGIGHSPFSSPGPLIDAIEEFVTGRIGAAEPERVLATVMFSDIVDSTARAAAAGDGAWRETLAQHDLLVREQLKSFEGVEVKTLGDGFLATFDGPARAARCALAMVEAARGLGLDMRVGIHTGEIERTSDDIAGLGVHIASRIGSLATAGEVLASRTVKDLVAGSGLVFDERGEHELKGVPDRWALYAVSG